MEGLFVQAFMRSFDSRMQYVCGFMKVHDTYIQYLWADIWSMPLPL